MYRWAEPGAGRKLRGEGEQDGGPGDGGQLRVAGPGGKVLGAGGSSGQEGGLGPREDAMRDAVTNCIISRRVYHLGWAWVDWEATGHDK